MMRQTMRAAVLSVLAVAAVGCSDDTTAKGGTGATQDVPSSTADVGLDDLAAVDAGSDEGLTSDDAGGADTSVAEDASTGSDAQCGDAGCNCVDDGTCNSGFCIEVKGQKQCAALCSGNCPDGFKCKQVTGSGGDVGSICVSTAPRVCEPCMLDTDCTGALGGAESRCIAYQDASGVQVGQFCGAACDATTPCPGGYSCKATTSVGGVKSQQCVKDDQTCSCDPRAVSLGLSTTCQTSNDAGKCGGKRVCSAAGLSACDGPMAQTETCDSQDNDCDGQIDEGVAEVACDLVNVYGTCQGKTFCVGGKSTCQGVSASAEICDGIDNNCSGATDEGSPNTDGDAQADCVDKDDDNDAVDDDKDNCPLAANLDQLDTDGDKAGDACDADDDGDKVDDDKDNCPLYGNATQADADTDGKGDVCDCDLDGDGIANAALGCPADATATDNCLTIENPTQGDIDGDGKGDLCDDDMDGDGVANATDNCAKLANADQADNDKDGQGDVCDGDDDNDTIGDEVDNCPLAANLTQTDLDADKLGDACDPDMDGDGVANATDNCPGTANADQADLNTNKIGDACETDWDADGVVNADDNCPWSANASQADLDGDKQGDACDCDADGDGVKNAAYDCAKPAAPDNCTLVVNADQADLDADGQGDLCDSDKDGDGDPNEGDCQPANKAISKFAKETCNGADDDCDAATDEEDAVGCKSFFFDGDGDGAGVTLVKCLCAPSGEYSATVAGDCNDQNKEIYPKAQEICGNGQDDNCNGSENDENAIDCKVWYSDKDGDGYGSDLQKCLCTQTGDFTAKQKGDCNDVDTASSPGQTEVCQDKKDNDCNGKIDEAGCKGCVTYFKDVDGDGFGVATDSSCLSGPGNGYTALKSGDCNDADKLVSPSATESCNGKDDNCNAQIDEANATGCKVYFQDEDKDTFGTGTGQCLCKATGLLTAANATDCNDKDATVNPSKAEICGNGKDDNCAGGESEENALNCAKFYLDSDKDGVGVATNKCLCNAVGLYTASAAGDCNDADNTMAPTLAEKCQDKKDNDCDTLVDEENCLGCVTYYKDGDADGYGLAADKKCLSSATAPYSATLTGDCNDASNVVSPKAVEACNSIDDNCNSQIDEANATGCKSFFTDADKDTFGIGTAQCLCAATGTVTATKDGDCDDKDANVNPAKPEVCGNGKDDNCTLGEADVGGTGCVNYFSDGDGDAYGVGTAKCLCAPAGAFSAKLGGDCVDTDPAINPAQIEKCLDTKDNNCNGQVDEAGCQGCQNYFKDADLDQFGVDTDKQCLGAAKYPYTAFIGGDCNDDPAKGGANQKPGLLEICDGLDNNCDGQIDPTGTSGCQNYYPDVDKDGVGASVSALCLCKANTTYTVTTTGDCNDANAAVSPKAVEVCDTIDNNCNNQVDEGVQKTFYKDEDLDGFGGPTSQLACTAPTGWAASAGDCNDFNKLINPKAVETCNDIDDNCNSLVDDGLATQTIYKDNDGDKFAALGAASQVKCNVPVGWALAQDINGDTKPDWDCVDSDAAVYPGAPDVCDDGKDNDCDGSVDKLCYASCGGSWPFQLKYSNANYTARPFDYDGDGNYEVMVQDGFGFAILTTTGVPLYNYSAANYNYARGTAATADVDSYNTYGAGTQNLEIVTANGSLPRIYKINDDGTVSVIENKVDGVFDGTKYLVSDLNYDGQPELIYQTWCDKTAGSKVFRFNPATLAIELQTKIADPDGVCQYYGRFLSDLNNDGVAELVVGNGYPGDGGAVSPTQWGGKVLSYKLTDPAKATFAEFCAPGSCFATAITGQYGVYTSNNLRRIGDAIHAEVFYTPTNVAGQLNATTANYWSFDTTGKPLAGSPSTSVVPNFYPTDIDDNGVVENNSLMQPFGLFDVDGDGYPDQLYTSGSELRVALWNPTKKIFVENVPSRRVISAGALSLRGIWDMNGDGLIDVTTADSAGKVYCHSLGAKTWNKKSSLPPHDPSYLRTGQWDNFEPNPGDDVNADGLPDRVIRLASAMTRKGDFYSYLSSATDKDFFQVDASWGGNICLTAPKGRSYTLNVYSFADKWANATQVAPGDGKPDGKIWTGKTPVGGQVCFAGNSVVPFRYGEYKFIVGIESAGDFSPYWPYWLNVNK